MVVFQLFDEPLTGERGVGEVVLCLAYGVLLTHWTECDADANPIHHVGVGGCDRRKTHGGDGGNGSQSSNSLDHDNPSVITDPILGAKNILAHAFDKSKAQSLPVTISGTGSGSPSGISPTLNRR